MVSFARRESSLVRAKQKRSAEFLSRSLAFRANPLRVYDSVIHTFAGIQCESLDTRLRGCDMKPQSNTAIAIETNSSGRQHQIETLSQRRQVPGQCLINIESGIRQHFSCNHIECTA